MDAAAANDFVVAEPAAEEEEEEEEDEEEEGEEGEEGEEEEHEDRDGVYDGGVAEPLEAGKTRRRASEADITLYLRCFENFKRFPDHPILKIGVTVQIGFDKSTKLAAVFERYVEFCNEKSTAALSNSSSNSDTTSSSHSKSNPQVVHPVDVRELEFVHTQLLSGQDIAEGAALMKNDQITVRADRSREREAEVEHQKFQDVSDKMYFQQMRGLIPSVGGSENNTTSSSSGATSTTNTSAARYCDVILDCQGPVYDDAGRLQRVMRPTLQCHSVIVSKRCPWLRRFIEAARISQKQTRGNSVSVVEMLDESDPSSQNQKNTDSNEPAPAAGKESDDEDDIGLLNFGNKLELRPRSSVAQIENDEDDDNQDSSESQRCRPALWKVTDETMIPYRRDESSLLRVVLPDHPYDAVRILLYYCYTNRVEQLGYDAFVKSCKTRPGHEKQQLQPQKQGPCPPYPCGNHRRWPNHGLPTVSFRTALSALKLAEDASLPRLSLMCEIAASQLITTGNVVDALSICQTQKLATGNSLPILRRAAMDVVLRSGPRGVYALPTFRQALEERSSSLVPTLLTGTAEAMQQIRKGGSAASTTTTNNAAGAAAGNIINVNNKRDWQAMALEYWDDLDYSDACAREQERHKRRIERLSKQQKLTEEEAKRLFEKPRRKGDAAVGSSSVDRRGGSNTTTCSTATLKRMNTHGRLGGNRVVASLAARRSRRGPG